MIAVERAVAAPPEWTFDFLADLRNHWRLERRFLELDELGEDGGLDRAPLGFPEASPCDRLFLALGGRAWFEGLFRDALENLDAVL